MKKFVSVSILPFWDVSVGGYLIFLQIQADSSCTHCALTILYDKMIRLVAYQRHDLSGKTGLTSPCSQLDNCNDQAVSTCGASLESDSEINRHKKCFVSMRYIRKPGPGRICKQKTGWYKYIIIYNWLSTNAIKLIKPDNCKLLNLLQCCLFCSIQATEHTLIY